jgi:SpoVK/Ycf46/Vps4 family AAA+-type ATPase
MNATDVILMFARARTEQDRKNALRNALTCPRITEDQRAEFRKLLNEAELANARVLRPLVNPIETNHDLLPMLVDGAPVLSSELRSELDEWITGWKHESLLDVNQCAPPGPLLLHGPTGCGKTTAARSLVREMNGRAGVIIECHRVTDSFMGSTGGKLSKAFDSCQTTGALLCIEEIDGLSEGRQSNTSAGGGAQMENNRVSIALMRLIECARFPIVATTNRPECLDTALLRRFEFKCEVKAPSLEARVQILSVVLGYEPAGDLLAMELTQSIPLARRMKRKDIIKRLAE